MTPQALSLEGFPLACTPQRPFFARFGYLGTCVLPAEVLDNTALPDLGTRLIHPTLRQRCSFQGLCFAHVLHSFAEGLYWAVIAATPDLANAERVLLTEAHLTHALAWDERLHWREPALIRRLMQAHARDLEPLGPHAEPEPPVDQLSALEGPLTVVPTIEGELHGALDTEGSHRPLKAPRHAPVSEVTPGPCVFLCVPCSAFCGRRADRFLGSRARRVAAQGSYPASRLARGMFQEGVAMIQKRLTQVIITTPRGQVVVARRVFERLEGKMRPDDLGLLRDYDYWLQLSELISGIQFTTPAQLRRVLP